jgi:hypothetical protein
MAKPQRDSKMGYGISLARDFSRNWRPSSGAERVAEAMMGRVLDSLFYAPSYGIRLAQRIRDQQPVTYAGLASEVERELLKDDRVGSVEVFISHPDSQGVVTVTINGTTSEEDEFNLIGSANALTGEQIRFQ